MFKYFLFLTLLVVVLANEDDLHAEVKSAYNSIDGNGNYKYGHDISNGVEIKAEGNVNGVHGEYYLLGENGEKIKVTYTADSTGFHPVVGAK
ncbi:pupal cuticle protein Edg-78E-like [Teleopsis dalmanni]|uniref:pupal cuticle protein Edg-78E-like n=1 Tax=Teleopsis dalmanni TaxID=139649 RepID=UPI0018CCDB34|nr:pupal cuticle protein Edg-78E-like [Teleopsis dalmanni]XP_037945380.1 pupal cuticle protein Edg-78E-like [Teleopsis dalmanni]